MYNIPAVHIKTARYQNEASQATGDNILSSASSIEPIPYRKPLLALASFPPLPAADDDDDDARFSASI